MMLISKLFIPVLLLACETSVANAHAILMYSVPALAGHALPGQLDVELRFNSLIDAKRSRVSLAGTDGQERVLSIAPNAVGDALLAHVTVVAGPNMLHWQVLAIDGHITRGNVPFDVQPADRLSRGAMRNR